MNQLNSLILEGFATKKATVKQLDCGLKVATFTLGTNRYYKDKDGNPVEEVSYIECQCFNKLADAAEQKICKGRETRIVGRLKQDRWKDETGKWNSKVYVLIEHLEVKGIKKIENTEENEKGENNESNN